MKSESETMEKAESKPEVAMVEEKVKMSNSYKLIQQQQLRAELENTFNKLPDLQSGADLAVVKQLLAEVARAQKKIADHFIQTSDNSTNSFNVSSSSQQILFDVFNFAFRKLPFKMREQFLAIYGIHLFGINLKNLIAFLQAEIVSQHSKTVWLLKLLTNNNNDNNSSDNNNYNKKKQQFSDIIVHLESSNSSNHLKLKENSNINNNENNNNNSAVLYCNYCKTVGHLAANCCSIRELLCFQCYQYGHTKRVCTNAPLM